MPGPRVHWVLLGAVLLSGAGLGCASTTAPPEWLPAADEAGTFVHGGWATAEWRRGDEKVKTHGELIAVSDSSVFVLNKGEGWNPGSASGGLIEIQKKDIKKIKVMSYRANLNPVVSWATIGTVSTLSHGWGLILSAPLWILVGTATTVTAADEPQDKFPKDSWDVLAKSSRFPQGMPPGVTLVE